MPSRRWIVAIVLLAVSARAGAVLALQSHKVPRSTYEHGEIAANLLAGKGFSIHFLGADGPTSQQAPLYPAIVAGAYALGGVESPRALLILELGQALLGGLTAFAAMRLAREVAPERPKVAILSGVIVALHPTLIYAATHVQVAPLATLLLVTTLALAYRTGRTGKFRDAAATGGLLALLALTDPILAITAVGIAWAIARGQGIRQAVRPLAIVGLVAAVGVAPWIARNYRVHGELVWVKSTFGYAFWQGNCTLSEGTDKVVRPSVERILLARKSGGLRGWNESLWAARHEAGYIDDIALTKAEIRELSLLTEPARSRALFRRALADLRAEPGRYLKLCLRRLRYFVFFDETNPKTRSLVYRASHFGLTILAVAGWFLMGAEMRRKLGPTLLVAALITLFHALTIVSARFHIPLEPLMATWGAAGLARLGLSAARSDVEGIGVMKPVFDARGRTIRRVGVAG